MSIQISLALSEQDEADLAQQLSELSPMKFHARMFPVGSYAPAEFVTGLAALLACFRSVDEPLVRRCVSPILGRPELEQIGSFHGLSIEWHRTEWPRGDTCVPGRLYLDDRTPVNGDVTEELRKIMRRLIRRVRTKYPRKSTDRIPYYAAPDLCRRIVAGEVRLIYAGGKEMRLISNLP